MGVYNSNEQMRDSLLLQLSNLDVAVPPPFFTQQTEYSDSATLGIAWRSVNLKERMLILRCLLRYDAHHIGTDNIVKLLSSVNLGGTPDNHHLEGLHRSVLNLHSALLVKLLQVSSPERYFIISFFKFLKRFH